MISFIFFENLKNSKFGTSFKNVNFGLLKPT